MAILHRSRLFLSQYIKLCIKFTNRERILQVNCVSDKIRFTVDKERINCEVLRPI